MPDCWSSKDATTKQATMEMQPNVRMIESKIVGSGSDVVTASTATPTSTTKPTSRPTSAGTTPAVSMEEFKTLSVTDPRVYDVSVLPPLYISNIIF